MPVAQPIRVKLPPVAAYARWAATYDAEQNPLLALERRVLAPLLPPVAGLTVVDVGCGTGRWTQWFANRGAARVLGVDLSLPMLAVAAGKTRLNSGVACGDASALPVAAAIANFVLSSFTASYVPDFESFARELARICAAGARIVVTDLHPAAAARGWRRTFRDGTNTYEVESVCRSVEQCIEDFWRAGLELDEFSEHCFGEAEREIFAAHGKPELFEQAREVPAIAVFHLARRNLTSAPHSARRKHQWRFVLAGARVALGPDTAVPADVVVRGARIEQIVAPGSAASELPRVDLRGLLLLPGLINAHDHLEFSLFPRLGSGPYANCREWAADIHHPDRSPVREHRQVGKGARLRWGGLKNLLCGATTVSHHNEFVSEVFTRDFPVRVLRRYGWAHSLAFDDVAAAVERTPPSWPVIIHAGEGTDALSRRELAELDAAGALGPRSVIVHNVAFDGAGLRQLRERGAALIWCPSSNSFTLGTSLSAAAVQGAERAALGSDSAISGAGDLLDEISFAQRECGASSRLLYELVTTRAADVLRLGRAAGRIARGTFADVVAISERGDPPCEALASAGFRDVEFVSVFGEPRLLSPAMREQNPGWAANLERIEIEGCVRWVKAPVQRLLDAARPHLGSEIRLAGKRVLA